MNTLTILMPSLRTPELLELSIPSLLNSLTVDDAKIIVILSEADDESKRVLDRYKVYHIDRENNIGPSAIDYALPFLDSKYVTCVNSDMFFAPRWDRVSIETVERFYPASCSCVYIENNGPWYCDNIGPFCKETEERFLLNVKSDKYNQYKMRYGFSWPITIKTEDFISIGGVFDNFDQDWIDVNGRGGDTHLAWRLKKLNDNYRFIINPKAIVFHGVGLTVSKTSSKGLGRGHEVFQRKTGISMNSFIKSIHYGEDF